MLIYDVVHYRKLSILIIQGCNFLLCYVYDKMEEIMFFQKQKILKAHIVKFRESKAITFDIVKYCGI